MSQASNASQTGCSNARLLNGVLPDALRQQDCRLSGYSEGQPGTRSTKVGGSRKMGLILDRVVGEAPLQQAEVGRITPADASAWRSS